MRNTHPAVLLSIASLAIVCASQAGEKPVQFNGYAPFYVDGVTYLFGQEGHHKKTAFNPLLGMDAFQEEPVTNPKSACIWRVNRADDSERTVTFELVHSRSKMSSFQSHGIVFQLDGRPYLFTLHETGAFVWRLAPGVGAGVELALGPQKMSSRYRCLTAFQLDGKPHIVGLHEDAGANIWAIENAPNTPKGLSFSLIKRNVKMSEHHFALWTMYLQGHPYILGEHYSSSGPNRVNIWKVRKNPKEGLDLVAYRLPFQHCNVIIPFVKDGRALVWVGLVRNSHKERVDLIKEWGLEGGYDNPILGATFWLQEVGLVEKGWGHGSIWEIAGPPERPTFTQISKRIPISHTYKWFSHFELNGQFHVVGIHEDGARTVWKINQDPSTGFSL